MPTLTRTIADTEITDDNNLDIADAIIAALDAGHRVAVNYREIVDDRNADGSRLSQPVNVWQNGTFSASVRCLHSDRPTLIYVKPGRPILAAIVD